MILMLLTDVAFCQKQLPARKLSVGFLAEKVVWKLPDRIRSFASVNINMLVCSLAPKLLNSSIYSPASPEISLFAAERPAVLLKCICFRVFPVRLN